MNKFNVGDKVKVVRPGHGCSDNDIGIEVEIICVGQYFDEIGYKVSPAIGNMITGSYKGFIGGKSFEKIDNQTNRRPHYDVIIAWANGADVEVYCKAYSTWVDCPEPSFMGGHKYRVKPTNQQNKEIARIESEMRKLADELRELKNANTGQ